MVTVLNYFEYFVKENILIPNRQIRLQQQERERLDQRLQARRDELARLRHDHSQVRAERAEIQQEIQQSTNQVN